MVLNIAFLIVGLVLLYYGAEALVRGSAALALRLGVTPLLVGLTIVAFGTSAPELVVSLRAAMSGSSDIALGNVVGSNICNVLLILGLAALINPLKVELQIVKIQIPTMIAVSLLLWLFLLNGVISRPEALLLLMGFAAFNFGSYWLSRRQLSETVQEIYPDAAPQSQRPTWLNIVFIIAGLALLVLGADLLVKGAVSIAKALGFSEAVIGLTVVAVGTSLPELATSVVAAVKNEADIAVGNVVGSNIFNILLIIGTSAMVTPVPAGGITFGSLAVMTLAAVVALPMAWTGFKLNRVEGALLLSGYVVYVVWLLI